MFGLLVTLIFAGALAAALYAIGVTLIPALPRIVEILRGAENQPFAPAAGLRRATIRVATTSSPSWREFRAAA